MVRNHKIFYVSLRFEVHGRSLSDTIVVNIDVFERHGRVGHISDSRELAALAEVGLRELSLPMEVDH